MLFFATHLLSGDATGLHRDFVPQDLFVLPFTLLVVLAVLAAAINTFVKSLHRADHHPIRIGDERGRLVTAWPVMTKSRAPAG